MCTLTMSARYDIDGTPHAHEWCNTHGVWASCSEGRDSRISELEAQIERLKDAFRVNMLRLNPSISHDDITAAINAALLDGGRRVLIPKLSTEAAIAKVREIDQIESASCHSVYVGTRFQHRHLIHRVHDLAGCDHMSIGWIDRQTETALAAAGVEIRD